MTEVLMINQSRIWGGGEKWFLQNAEGLAQLGKKSTIACFLDSPLFHETKRKGSKIEILKLGRFPFNYFSISRCGNRNI